MKALDGLSAAQKRALTDLCRYGIGVRDEHGWNIGRFTYRDRTLQALRLRRLCSIVGTGIYPTVKAMNGLHAQKAAN